MTAHIYWGCNARHKREEQKEEREGSRENQYKVGVTKLVKIQMNIKGEG